MRERMRISRLPKSTKQKAAKQDDWLVLSKAAVNTLDEEDIQKAEEMDDKKKPIVSVHGTDVEEKQLDEAA